MFANGCDEFFKSYEENKKNYKKKYGKDWNEIVNLSNQNKFEHSDEVKLIEEQVKKCKENPNYYDDVVLKGPSHKRSSKSRKF